jgi:carbon monoxide dehydrogenase subunit G
LPHYCYDLHGILYDETETAMNLTGSRTINADINTVWAGLLDPEVLKACVPGCTEMAGSADDGFEATVVQKVGPVKATFKGAVSISDRVEHESLTISGEGKGGPAGFAKGGADVRLETDGDATILHYDVEAKVGGKLAQLGSRIIDGFAKKMADQFFANFQEAVEPPEENDEAEDDTEETKKKGWFSKLRGG